MGNKTLLINYWTLPEELFISLKDEIHKKLIILSLMKEPKSIMELANELVIGQSSINIHIHGSPSYSDPLIGLNIVEKIGEKLLRRGGYAKVNIFGIKDLTKANKFLNKN